jgi:hypothetical protein
MAQGRAADETQSFEKDDYEIAAQAARISPTIPYVGALPGNREMDSTARRTVSSSR